MYDHIVAGGQPHGISPFDNVIKECEEEASIPLELAQLAKSVGAVFNWNSSFTISSLLEKVLIIPLHVFFLFHLLIKSSSISLLFPHFLTLILDRCCIIYKYR